MGESGRPYHFAALARRSETAIGIFPDRPPAAAVVHRGFRAEDHHMRRPAFCVR